jgi:hypothetical protein
LRSRASLPLKSASPPAKSWRTGVWTSSFASQNLPLLARIGVGGLVRKKGFGDRLCGRCSGRSRFRALKSSPGGAMIQFHVRRIREAISAKLGRCPRCWRLSFRGAVIGWIGAGVIHLLFQDARVWYVVLIWPISFSILWLLHIATFGLRVVAAEREKRSLPHLDRTVGEQQLLASSVSSILAGTAMGRRQMLLRLYRSAGWSVLVSAAVPLASACSNKSVPSSTTSSSGGSTGGGTGAGTKCPCPPNSPPGTWYCPAAPPGFCIDCPTGCVGDVEPNCAFCLGCTPC